MKEYRDISSLCHDLRYSARGLYTLSNQIEKHYHDVTIPKANGEERLLHVPDNSLKNAQKKIADRIPATEEISPYAVAYRPGGSTKANANPHVGADMIMKCDIRKFFDHITFPLLRKKVFPSSRYSDSISILLSILCVYSHSTPQGAPTSPAISNIILRDFDNRIGEWCASRNITFTRYCDDMTFSGDFNPSELKKVIQDELQKEGFFLNAKKTVVVKKGQRMSVTGIVVNEKLFIPRDYKKKIRQEIYFCKKYGVKSHLKNIAFKETPYDYYRKLLGRINYVISVENDNAEMIAYRNWILNRKYIEHISTKKRILADYHQKLREMCYKSAQEKNVDVIPVEIIQRIETELKFIENNNLSGYFVYLKKVIDLISKKMPVKCGRWESYFNYSYVAYLLNFIWHNPIDADLNVNFFINNENVKRDFNESSITIDTSIEMIELSKYEDKIKSKLLIPDDCEKYVVVDLAHYTDENLKTLSMYKSRYKVDLSKVDVSKYKHYSAHEITTEVTNYDEYGKLKSFTNRKLMYSACSYKDWYKTYIKLISGNSTFYCLDDIYNSLIQRGFSEKEAVHISTKPFEFFSNTGLLDCYSLRSSCCDIKQIAKKIYEKKDYMYKGDIYNEIDVLLRIMECEKRLRNKN